MNCNEVGLYSHDIIEIGKMVKWKWKRIANGKQKDNGMLDCAYCFNFYSIDDFECEDIPWHTRCLGCPIEYFTKRKECLSTPYPDFRREKRLYGDEPSAAIKMKTFIDEIFIRSLLLIDWRKYYEMPSL
ncbi:hypothetical protein KA005_49535 [bacterium]|nr:hypothetical protein [bacterium]